MDINLLLRHFLVVVKDSLLNVQRVCLLLQLVNSTAQNGFPSVLTDVFTHAFNGVLQFLELLTRQTPLIVHGQFAHNNGNGLVVGGVMSCQLLTYVEYFGSQVAKGGDGLGTDVQCRKR